MAARVRKIRHDEETRAKIQTSQLINRLTGHAFGDVELSATQVRAIEILLRKTLPDLTESNVTIEKHERFDWTRDELVEVLRHARAGSARAVSSNGRGGEPDSVH